MTVYPRGPQLNIRSLVFEDHFNGSMRPEWRSGLWWNGSINKEQQAYRKEALRQMPDRLIIDVESLPTALAWDATKLMPYRSGLIHTHGSLAVTSGIVEVRCKVPKAKGLWPAIWLCSEVKDLPKPVPEIDILEMLGTETSTLRMNYHNGVAPAQPRVYKSPLDLSAGYHVYTCKWGPEGISFWVDGKYVEDIKGPGVYPGPYHLVINCAVGGWAGQPDPVINQEMWIDYVRVWA